MKKFTVLAVVLGLALAFSVNAAEKTTVKKEVKGTEQTTEVKTKSGGTKVKVEEAKTPATTNVTADITKKQGDVAKEEVTFKRYDSKGDFIYVIKDNKEYRLQHNLSDDMKKNMLSWKVGKPVTITSTRALSNDELVTAVAEKTGINKAKILKIEEKMGK
jgi:hypothetical protein